MRHKIYETIGSAGKPVLMGTYDISLYRSIGISFLGCRQDNIMDRTLWGVHTSNYCKDILVDGCTLSRVDAHMYVSNMTVRRSVIGWMGIKATGQGQLLVEDTAVHAGDIVELRMDYGSTWDGDITIRNVTWYPSWRPEWRPTGRPAMISGLNFGSHDFGYPCSQPRRVRVENVRVMDREAAAEPGWAGVAVLMHLPQVNSGLQGFGDPLPGDFPYRAAERIDVRGVTVDSGAGLAIWSAYPATGYAAQPHDVRGGAPVTNCAVSLTDVGRVLLQTPDAPPEVPYGHDHRVVPSIVMEGCGAVERAGLGMEAYPMAVIER